MAGTTISQIDTDDLNDHSYYGNGCRRDEYPEGANGCTKSGTGRLVTSVDGDTISMGTYYNFQAATSGAGGAITTDNTNSPDTFCPLGWQLPYSGTGGDYYHQSRSIYDLFTTYSIPVGEAAPDWSSLDSIVSYPLSIARAGHYLWTTGLLYNLGHSVIYWSLTTLNDTRAYRLLQLDNDNPTPKADGMPLRCVRFLASHHRRHGGRNTCRSNHLC